MRKLGIVLAIIVLLSGCHVKPETELETVSDDFGPLRSQPYRIVFTVPEDVIQETFGDQDAISVYTAENGDYRLTTEVLDTGDVDLAIETICGIPADRLDVVELNRAPMKEFHFAWSSTGEEETTVSKTALIATEDHCYALTMTEKVGLGKVYQETAESVFGTFALCADDTE